MIFFLFLFCTSKWWNFTDGDFYVYMQEDSKLVPIFSLFTNSTESNNTIYNFKNFSLNFKSKHQIDFTHIDCLKTNFCTTHVQINDFPSLYLMQGPNYVYWKKINNKNWGYEINSFIDSSNPELITNEQQLFNMFDKIKNGGSLFHLTIQSQFRTVLKFFNQFSRYYRIFSSSFIYSIDENIRVATIKCYFSQNCFYQRRIRPIDIESFFEENKFSFYHIYHQKEIKDYIESNPFALIIFQNQSQLIVSREKVYHNFYEQCNKFKFGFVDSKLNQNFIKAFNLENKIQPFIFAINIFNDCYSTLPIDANKSSFEKVLNGTNCERIGRKFNLIPRKPKKIFTMASFVLSFGFIYAFFYCVKTSKRDDPFLVNQYGYKDSPKVVDDDEEFQTLKHLKID